MDQVELISRRVLFDNPEKAAVTVSPDGAHLAWVAPVEGVQNLWVAPVDDPGAARPITRDAHRGVRHYAWTYAAGRLVYLQDLDGDENWRLYLAELDGCSPRPLTPGGAVRCEIIQLSPRRPEDIVIALNRRDPKAMDLHRLNLVTGEMALIMQADDFAQGVVDLDLELQLAMRPRGDGGFDLHRCQGETWPLWMSVDFEDALAADLHAIAGDGRTLIMSDSCGRDTAALWAVDLDSGQRTLLAADERCDMADLVLHPLERRAQAVSFTWQRRQWTLLDDELAADFDALKDLGDGELSILSRSLDQRLWVVGLTVDDGPQRFYLYRREQRRAELLFVDSPALAPLAGRALAPMHSFAMTALDGLELVGYYTLPVGSDRDGDGVPDEPLPMVFTPHGGPWWRDSWGYNAWHQWLANRGYAVLSVNFRASTGFGKALINAGDRQWGRAIQHDQVDAVRWAIERGIADADRVGVLGGSFGGYSVLAGLTFEPELYACGVDLVGPSDLVTMLESFPAYWSSGISQFVRRVGEFRSEEGRRELREQSPLYYLDRIVRPLLIVQGANDPRVTRGESDRIVEGMQRAGLPVTYLLYGDEGHGFARPENNFSFYAVAEAFLARCLGGRCEPIGRDLAGSSMEVLAGAEHVAGLQEALGARQGD